MHKCTVSSPGNTKRELFCDFYLLSYISQTCHMFVTAVKIIRIVSKVLQGDHTHTWVSVPMKQQHTRTGYAYAFQRLSVDVTHLLTKDTPFWMLSDSSFFAFSSPALSNSLSGPSGKISSMPERPRRTLDAKKGSSVTCEST